MTSRIYRTWVNRICGDERPSRAIQNQAAKVIWPLAHSMKPQGHRTALDYPEAFDLFFQFRQRVIAGDPILVPDAQAKIGRDWLDLMAARNRIPKADYQSISEFAWVGCSIVRETDYWTIWAPTYCGQLADGRSVRYTPTAWQASAYGARRDDHWEIPFFLGDVLLNDDGRGYSLIHDGAYYRAGCRVFTVDEAILHWSNPYHEDPRSAARLLAAVEAHHARSRQEVAA